MPHVVLGKGEDNGKQNRFLILLVKMAYNKQTNKQNIVISDTYKVCDEEKIRLCDRD